MAEDGGSAVSGMVRVSPVTHLRRAYLLSWSLGGPWMSRPVTCVLDEATRAANELIDTGRAVAVIDEEHRRVVYQYRAPEPAVATVADQLFLIATDEDGGARVHGDVLGLVLAAALLAELVFSRRVDIADDGTVLLLSYEAPSSDPLAHRVFGLIRREQQQRRARDVGMWIRVLAADAYERVGGRLVDAGMVSRESGRRIFRQAVTVYPAASPEWAAYVSVRLHTALHIGPLRTADSVLAALVEAAGLFP